MKQQTRENEFYTVRAFADNFPNLVRSHASAKKLAANRHYNGLVEFRACVKKPGKSIMFHRANFERWLLNEED